MIMRKLFILLVILTALSSLSVGQAYTNITAAIQDSSGQIWSSVTIRATIVPPFGNPGPLLNQGHPITDSPQYVIGDSAGNVAFTLDDNNVVSPAGSSWQFDICSNTTSQCSGLKMAVTGPSMDLSSIINGSIIPPAVQAVPNIARAYKDTETSGGNGSLYWRTADNTLWGCQTSPTSACPPGWQQIGLGPAYYQTLQNAGVNQVQRRKLNLIAGTNISYTISDNAGSDSSDVTINAGAFSGFYQTIQSAGTPFTQRHKLNFLNTGNITFTLADNAGNDSTDVVGNSTVLPSSPALGDTIRYNTQGDSKWDAVNMAQPISYIYPVWGGTTPGNVGPMSTGFGFLGGHTSINPTATAGTGDQYASSAVASTNTVAGMTTGQNGNNSIEGMLAFYRYTLKFAAGSTTNVRYWLGLGSWSSTGTANNTLAILGTTAYAADVPNKTTLGFRYSSGTDTHWQAIAAVAGGSQTTTDTGVTPDTSPHVFEMITNTTGTSVSYLIDGAVVAVITTNLPVPASVANSWGNFFWTADNKNTGNVAGGIFYYWMLSHK